MSISIKICHKTLTKLLKSHGLKGKIIHKSNDGFLMEISKDNEKYKIEVCNYKDKFWAGIFKEVEHPIYEIVAEAGCIVGNIDEINEFIEGFIISLFL